jgi:hypothetical protein
MAQVYLVHIHPILPVIEADVLLNYHPAKKRQDYNLLLLWSLVFVAVNVRRDVDCLSFPKQIELYSSFQQLYMSKKVTHLEGQ